MMEEVGTYSVVVNMGFVLWGSRKPQRLQSLQSRCLGIQIGWMLVGYVGWLCWLVDFFVVFYGGGLMGFRRKIFRLMGTDYLEEWGTALASHNDAALAAVREHGFDAVWL